MQAFVYTCHQSGLQNWFTGDRDAGLECFQIDCRVDAVKHDHEKHHDSILKQYIQAIMIHAPNYLKAIMDFESLDQSRLVVDQSTSRSSRADSASRLDSWDESSDSRDQSRLVTTSRGFWVERLEASLDLEHSPAAMLLLLLLCCCCCCCAASLLLLLLRPCCSAGRRRRCC